MAAPMALRAMGLVRENDPLAFWASLTQAMPGWLRAALKRLGVASQTLAAQVLRIGQNTQGHAFA